MSGIKDIGESTAEAALSDQVRKYIGCCDEKQDEISKAKHGGLTQKCIQVVAEHFNSRPVLSTEVSPALLKSIVSSLPESTDLTTAALHVHYESYWQQACVEKFGIAQSDLCEHGLSWKRVFLEKHLQHLIENSPRNESHLEDFIEMVRPTRPT